MRDIAALALDGVLESALAVTIDVLDAGNRIEEACHRERPFSLRVLGRRASRVVTGAGYRRDIDGAFPPELTPDAIVVPGVEAPLPGEVDALLLREDARRAMRWLRRAHDDGALILASCTATFMLAEAGLLDGASATTSWFLAPHFHQRYPAVDLRQDAMVVESGRIVTAGAALSHVDLMLWLVRRLAGPKLADRCARALVIDDRPTQARYLGLAHLGTRSPEVDRAERFLRANLARQVTLAEVAHAAGASPRTMARRFEEAVGMSPLRFLRRLRVERAQHLLETTRRSMDEVAALVGYSDPIALRRLLHKELGRGARDIRARARARLKAPRRAPPASPP